LGFAPARYLIKFLLGRQSPGTYEQIVARTRLWDMAVLQLLKRNHSEGVKDARVQQLVILGAGYDTRAYRFDDLLLENKVRVFEVDREEMQSQKMHILAKVLGGKVPKYVSYVATDFKTGSLSKSLLDAGFDPKKIVCATYHNTSHHDMICAKMIRI
jgi:methyltransferase (TIGR00027 family)